MSLTNVFETRVLNWLLTNSSVTRPTQRHVGLFTASPGETGGGTEVSGNNYARRPVTFTVSGDRAQNNAAVEFAEATGNWGTVSHFALFDAATGGNMIAYGALQTPRSFVSGDVPRFPAAELAVVLD